MWEETACAHFAFQVALEQNHWNHSNSIVHLDIQVDHPNDCIYIWTYKLTIQITTFTFGYTSWPSKWLYLHLDIQVDHPNLHLDIQVDHPNDYIYIWIYKLTIQMTVFTFRYTSWPSKWLYLHLDIQVDHPNLHLDIQVDHPNDYIYIGIYKLTIQMTAFTFGYASWPSKWLYLHLDIEVNHSNKEIASKT